MEGVCSVCSKRCGRSGCTKWPSYGAPRSGLRETFVEHATDDMVSRTKRRRVGGERGGGGSASGGSTGRRVGSGIKRSGGTVRSGQAGGSSLSHGNGSGSKRSRVTADVSATPSSRPVGSSAPPSAAVPVPVGERVVTAATHTVGPHDVVKAEVAMSCKEEYSEGGGGCTSFG